MCSEDKRSDSNIFAERRRTKFFFGTYTANRSNDGHLEAINQMLVGSTSQSNIASCLSDAPCASTISWINE